MTVVVCLFSPDGAQAAALPGGDLVQLDYGKKFGLAVLTPHELFLLKNTGEWTEAGFWGRGETLSSIAMGTKVLLVGTDSGRILRSENGVDFAKMTSPKDPFGRGVAPIKYLAADPKGRIIAASSGLGLVVSRDGGTSWEAVSEPFWSKAEAREILHLGFVKGVLIVVTRNGVYSASGDRFSAFNDGLPDKPFITSAASENGRMLISVSGEGIYLAKNVNSWSRLQTTPAGPISFLGFTKKGYLAARSFSRVHSGDSKGKAWKPVGTGSPDFMPFSSVNSKRGTYLALRGMGLARLQGEKFEYEPLPRSLVEIYTELDVNGTTVVGTQAGVFRSTDSGKSWSDVTPPDLGKRVNTIIKVSDGRLLLGSDGLGVFVSSDDGEIWISWSRGLGTANTIEELIQVGSRILAATENGLMVTDLTPTPQWQSLETGVGRNAVRSLFFSKGRIWAAAVSGVYSASENLKFTRVKGLENVNSSIYVEDNILAIPAGNSVLVRDAQGQVEKLNPLPGGALPTSVLIRSGTVWAGSSRGLFRLVDGTWADVSEVPFPVKAMKAYKDRISVVTEGAGTYYLK